MTDPPIDGSAYGFPPGLSQPALRALRGAGYTSLEAVAAVSPQELLQLHGLGPKAIRLLRPALAARGLAFIGEEQKNSPQE